LIGLFNLRAGVGVDSRLTFFSGLQPTLLGSGILVGFPPILLAVLLPTELISDGVMLPNALLTVLLMLLVLVRFEHRIASVRLEALLSLVVVLALLLIRPKALVSGFFMSSFDSFLIEMALGSRLFRSLGLTCVKPFASGEIFDFLTAGVSLTGVFVVTVSFFTGGRPSFGLSFGFLEA
jgi:hypothetical protein